MQDKFTGLNTEQIRDSEQKYGKNVIVEKPPETFWERVKEGFGDPMIKLLCAIVVIMLVMFFFGQSDWYEPVGTMVAIILVTVISAKTGMASDDEYRKLKESTKAEPVKVRRNGEVKVIDLEDVVVGDIVILQSGDKIPADGILISGELRVDNSALNGEAEECKKFEAPDNFKMEEEITGDTFVDKHSLFRGATVYNGEGLMEVRRVGMTTMMGKMAEDMQGDEVDSPLKVKLSKLAHQISTFGYIGAIVIALAYLVHFVIVAGGVQQYLALGGLVIFKGILEAVTLAIVIVVCAVPEGLPLMIAIVLMQNSSRMLKSNVLVRKPIGIETAGSLNILFSDKTGTITKGKLEVVEFIQGDGKTIEVDDMAQEPIIKEHVDIAIGKNTTSMFDAEHKVVGGNATDQALMHFIGEETFKKLLHDTEHPVTQQQSFNSANKFSQSRIESLGKTFYKGAPERLLDKAKSYLAPDGTVSKLNRTKVDAAIDLLASKAMRVLAFGYSESPMIEDTINDDLVIIGFVGIRDDVRQEAKQAIKEVKGAGIQVVMITGDRLETAVAIAKDAGLLGQSPLVMQEYDNEVDSKAQKTDESDGIAITSACLNQMTDEAVKAIMKKIRVIARALPTDKSRMVKLCQEINLVTGMTGDGVNDSPALKRADVGFAMGSGTAVAKEAGDIVIIDDNFQSIRNAILYGRTIYHNILKFCKFQLVINVAAVLVSAIAPFIGIEEPLKVTHLLWINLVMDTLGALSLGNEPALQKYMEEAPRRRDESIVSAPMMVQICTMGVYFTVLSFIFLLVPAFGKLFENEAQHMTAYFCMFIFAAVVNGFNVRSDDWNVFRGLKDNLGFLKIMGIIAGVQVVLSLVGGEVFSCTPFGLMGWAVVILAALTVYPVDVIRKGITNLLVKNK